MSNTPINQVLLGAFGAPNLPKLPQHALCGRWDKPFKKIKNIITKITNKIIVRNIIRNKMTNI